MKGILYLKYGIYFALRSGILAGWYSAMKKRLIINYSYSIIICLIAAVFSLGFAVYTTICRHIVGMILFYILFGLTAFAGIISIQTITIDKEGFTIKCFFFRIVRINWDQIVKIEISNLNSLYSPYKTIQMKWIVFYTDNKQICSGGGANWKKSPWTIKATKKSRDTIRQFVPKDIPFFE